VTVHIAGVAAVVLALFFFAPKQSVPVVTSLSTVALYLAYTIPITLAWRAPGRVGLAAPDGMEPGTVRRAAESGGQGVLGLDLRRADHAAQ
jgi:hypothetical protein